MLFNFIDLKWIFQENFQGEINFEWNIKEIRLYWNRD